MRRWRVEVTARGGNLVRHEVDCEHAWQALLDAGRAGVLPNGECTVVVVDVAAENQRAVMAAGYC